MAYTALYRKWRPLTFDDVVGQPHITNTLKNEIQTGRVGHAYLFCGSRGTGKTSTARILSRAINCLNPQNGNPCNECENCRGILDGSILDITEIDAASNNGVENIRTLREEARFSGSSLSHRVYIVDEVHMLSTSAFNALLKILEEPPEHVHFILATTELHKVLPTIMSRCQRFDFKRITVTDIEQQINKILVSSGVTIDEGAVRLIAEKADGGMRDALSLLDQCLSIGEENLSFDTVSDFLGIGNRDITFSLAEKIANCDTKAAFEIISSLVAEGKNLPTAADELTKLFRDLLVCKYYENPMLALNMSEDDAERLKSIAGLFSSERIVQLIERCVSLSTMFRTGISPRLAFETALIKMTNPIYDSGEDALLARISILEEKIANGNFASAPKTQTKNIEPPKVQKAAPKPKAVNSEEFLKIKNSWNDIIADLFANNNLQTAMALEQGRAEEIDKKLAIVYSTKSDYNTFKALLSGSVDDIKNAVERICGFCPEVTIEFSGETITSDDSLVKLYNDNKE